MKPLVKKTAATPMIILLLASVWTTVVSSFLVPKSIHPRNKATSFPSSPLSIRGGDKDGGGGGNNILKKITSSAQGASMAQYADAASGLFSNMITPASILCGAIVPLCFASGLDFDGPDGESQFQKGT